MGRPARVTREQVLAEARRVFADRGFHGTTLADIAARLQVSPAALLRHAPTKEALFVVSMNSEPRDELLPTDFLVSISPSEDPPGSCDGSRGSSFHSSAEMGENIARFLRARTDEEARTSTSFRPRQKARRRLAWSGLWDLFPEGRAAGVSRSGSPGRHALAFLGSLQSYVFFHRVLRIRPPIPSTPIST
jgi:AcrR family transcriptional regulator